MRRHGVNAHPDILRPCPPRHSRVAAAALSIWLRGRDPDARSHGEAFLNLFGARFAPGSLVLLDEPEAALSPQSQLGLLAMLLDMTSRESQFLIATHSPIILGYPGALIYSFDGGRIERAAYDDLSHVRLTRDFLADRERFFRRLSG